MMKNCSANIKPRRKRNPIWTMPVIDFEALVLKSKTYTEVLDYWGFDHRGYYSRTLKARIQQDNIDDSHIKQYSSGEKAGWKTGRNLNEYLVLNGPGINGRDLKRKLISAGLKLDICEECGQKPVWNNKPLVLQLDHINGNNNDNRIENLRILCPHCHTQTDTFAGRNCAHAKPKKVCPNCNAQFNSRLKHCAKCATWRTNPRPSRHKVPHPTAEELKALVWSKPLTQLAVDLGVSDSAIHKWCRRLGVEKPPKGLRNCSEKSTKI
jgi:hypothetical protein